jgi:TRAP-type C4-dicarboxylate transport system substrate-binding protein
MNLDRWNALDPETQALIESEAKSGFEDPAWSTAQDALVNDIACLTGNGDCPAGEARGMTLVEASDADMSKAGEVLRTEVLPEWSERAGPEWTARWNDSVGAATGVTIE